MRKIRSASYPSELQCAHCTPRRDYGPSRCLRGQDVYHSRGLHRTATAGLVFAEDQGRDKWDSIARLLALAPGWTYRPNQHLEEGALFREVRSTDPGII